MHGMKEIIEEAESLPVEERVIVIDSLLRTLNPPNVENDKEWLAVSKRRLAELRSGTITPVPGNEVINKIRDRFAR